MENNKLQLITRILAYRRRTANQIRSQYGWKKPIPDTSGRHANPENHKKGVTFEKFVVERLDTRYHTLVEWRSDKSTEGIFPLMSKFPDLEYYYQFQNNSFQFAIECKWREHFYRNHIELDPFQLENYQHYEEVTGYKTFLIIGIGNTPLSPTNVYIIPLSEIKKNILHEFEIEVYRRIKAHDEFVLDFKQQRLI